MLVMLAPALVLAADSAAGERRFGAWQSTEQCASGFDSLGCTRTLGQSNPNLDVILIFRADFAIRATVRSCDQEAARLSFTPDPAKWKQLTPAARMDQARQVVAQWAKASVIGCDHPSALSFDGFEDGFSRLDAASSATSRRS